MILKNCDGVWNGDAGQVLAIIEALISQAGDGVGNSDARQARATIEAINSQTGDCISFSVH